MSVREFFSLTYPQLKSIIKYINNSVDETESKKKDYGGRIATSPAMMRKLQEEYRKQHGLEKP